MIDNDRSELVDVVHKVSEIGSSDEVEEPESEISSNSSLHSSVTLDGGAKLEVIEMPLPTENSKPRAETITHVVIHFISNAALNQDNPYNIDDIYDIFVEYGFSTHYVIDREGIIYLFVPEDRVAFHAGAGTLPDFPAYENVLNEYSIGIELLAIGTKAEMMTMISEKTYEAIQPDLIGYTDAQYESLNILLEDLVARNANIQMDRKHIVGHDTYAPQRKTDPGSLFDWSRIDGLN